MLGLQQYRGQPTAKTFIHSGYFYSASSSPLLLRGAPDTARILCRSFTPKRHRQLRVKDLSARAEFKPTTFLGDESTNKPLSPTILMMFNTKLQLTHRTCFLNNGQIEAQGAYYNCGANYACSDALKTIGLYRLEK